MPSRRRIALVERERDTAVVTLGASLVHDGDVLRLTYPTRTGALVQLDGRTVGAFDGKHETIDISCAPGTYACTLIVERRSLPIAGLPAGDGVRWRSMLARATQEPHGSLLAESVAIDPTVELVRTARAPLIGHAHLDVAWLWTYAEARRKARRTFASALRQIDDEPRYVFAQSQPQLYAWVEQDDPDLFTRIRERVDGAWDCSVAAMWVEPDLHAISGESILRQFALAERYVRDRFETTPEVVWLPDTFGFPNTLPQLAAHAGLRAFATTKLQWNDTNRWPYPQFRWYGDDGSSIAGAVLDRYDGTIDPEREAIAAERREPLVHGFGDGGGGALDADIAAQRNVREPWLTMRAWFDDVEHRILPEVRGELYLETHRGTYTTLRAVKARNATLERALEDAEEAVAWLIAVRASRSLVKPLADDLATARELLAKNQFHDVIAGTSIAAVYVDVHADYDRIERIVERVITGTRSVLPHADVSAIAAQPVEPQRDGELFVLANDALTVHVRETGTIVDLRGIEGPNLIGIANGLALFEDKPKQWDAWNLDRTYEQHPRRLRARGARIEDSAIVVNLDGKDVAIAMRIALDRAEPFVRVECNVRWQTTHRVLRVEHRLAANAATVRFGAPHGTFVRDLADRSPQALAKFEFPAQRFAHVEAGGHGIAVFTPDSYGWDARKLPSGGVRLGTSLLRAPRWPDPTADRGDHRIAWALAPTAGATIGDLENVWCAYAQTPRVRLFTSDTSAVLVVATKPADDGNGIIVRVRECDGVARIARLRCGARITQVESVDACERRAPGAVHIVGEELEFALSPFAIRTFRVTA